MATRKFAIKPPTWKKLRAIKDRLNAENGRVIPWDDAFQYILNYYTKGGGCIYKSKNNIAEKTPNQRKLKKEGGLKAPRVPPKKMKGLKIPPAGEKNKKNKERKKP